MRCRAGALLVVMFLGCVPLIVNAEPPTNAEMLEPFAHPKGYVCYRAASPITIDGDLTDAAWEAAPWTDAFADIEGDKQPKPRFRTRLKMLWDDEALYIAAELEEPHVWATLTEHDSVIFHDNDFEVFLDPDGDNHLYAELELNAKNTTWDLLLTKPYRDGGKALNGWEIKGLKTGVLVNGTLNDPRDKDTGWTLEIRWPWKGLKELMTQPAMPPKDGEQWRINFSRVEWDTEEQLGMVAARGDRHAPTRTMGLFAIQHGEGRQGGVPPGFRVGDPRPVAPCVLRPARLSKDEREVHDRCWRPRVEGQGCGSTLAGSHPFLV
jgi:hypothetical protein